MLQALGCIQVRRESEREVSQALAKNFAEDNEMEWIEVSAKDGTNIQVAFIQLLQVVHLQTVHHIN